MLGREEDVGGRPGREPVATTPGIVIRCWPAAGGGLLIGASAPVVDAGDARRDAGFFLRLGLDDNVSVIAPDAPLDGRTIARVTGIVADELDVPPDKIKTTYRFNQRRRGRGVVLPSGHDAEIDDMAADCLHTASAAILALLVCAAAESWRVMPGECHASMGNIIHRPTERRFRYGVLAADAALQRIPRRVTLRNGENRTILPV